MEIRERVQVLEQVFAQLLDLSFERSLGSFQLCLEECLGVDCEQPIGHVLRVKVAEALLGLGEVHLDRFVVVQLASTVIVEEDRVVEKFIQDALLDQFLDLDRDLSRDGRW